jgi:hypothetical protein
MFAYRSRQLQRLALRYRGVWRNPDIAARSISSQDLHYPITGPRDPQLYKLQSQ